MNTNKLLLLGVVLFVSLSINLFMAGMVVGSSVSAPHKAVSEAMAQDNQLRESLSDADKAVLQQVMDANRQKIARLHDDLENIKRDVKKIIKKEPMDEKALDAVLEVEKNKKLTLLRLIHETRQTAMKKMSTEGRALLSKVSRLGFNLNDSVNVQCR